MKPQPDVHCKMMSHPNAFGGKLRVNNFLAFFFAIKPLIQAFDVALHCLAELQEIEKENQGEC